MRNPAPENARCKSRSNVTTGTDGNRLQLTTSFRHGEEERQRLEELCRQTGRTKGDVIRRLILDKKLQSRESVNEIVVLTQLHGEFRKIGGLLKLGLRDRVADRVLLRDALIATKKTARVIEEELKKASSEP